VCLRDLRKTGLPVSGAWMVLESACHWMLIAVSPDWHEKSGLTSQELARKIGAAIFSTKTGFGIPKMLLVEDDFDFTDVNQIVWAFGSRAHPHHGEIYFEGQAQNSLPVFLDPNEKFTYHTTKVVHNCLLADRFPPGQRPMAADLTHGGWPPELVARVIANWQRYGYRT